jgi:hypothetical protein
MLCELAKPSVTTNMLLRWQAYCTTPVLALNWSPMCATVACVGVPLAAIEFR